jgi:transposase
MAAVAIDKRLPAGELRRLAGRERDSRVVRRLLALANVLDGMSRDAAARLAGMTRQTLRDWVHRYDAEGLEGLRDREREGRPPRLGEGEQAALVALVPAGPDPGRHGVTAWRLKDLCAPAEERFGVTYSDSGMFDLLGRLGVSWMTARPEHPASDPEAQAAYKESSQPRSPASGTPTPRPIGSRSGSWTRAGSGRRAG